MDQLACSDPLVFLKRSHSLGAKFMQVLPQEKIKEALMLIETSISAIDMAEEEVFINGSESINHEGYKVLSQLLKGMLNTSKAYLEAKI